MLLDRALAVVAYLSHRSHARRDEVVLRAEALLPAMTAAGLSVGQWEAARRRDGERVFSAMRRGRAGPRELDALQALLVPALQAVAERRLGGEPPQS